MREVPFDSCQEALDLRDRADLDPRFWEVVRVGDPSNPREWEVVHPAVAEASPAPHPSDGYQYVIRVRQTPDPLSNGRGEPLLFDSIPDARDFGLTHAAHLGNIASDWSITRHDAPERGPDQVGSQSGSGRPEPEWNGGWAVQYIARPDLFLMRAGMPTRYVTRDEAEGERRIPEGDRHDWRTIPYPSYWALANRDGTPIDAQPFTTYEAARAHVEESDAGDTLIIVPARPTLPAAWTIQDADTGAFMIRAGRSRPYRSTNESTAWSYARSNSPGDWRAVPYPERWALARSNSPLIGVRSSGIATAIVPFTSYEDALAHAQRAFVEGSYAIVAYYQGDMSRTMREANAAFARLTRPEMPGIATTEMVNVALGALGANPPRTIVFDSLDTSLDLITPIEFAVRRPGDRAEPFPAFVSLEEAQAYARQQGEGPWEVRVERPGQVDDWQPFEIPADPTRAWNGLFTVRRTPLPTDDQVPRHFLFDTMEEVQAHARRHGGPWQVRHESFGRTSPERAEWHPVEVPGDEPQAPSSTIHSIVVNGDLVGGIDEDGNPFEDDTPHPSIGSPDGTPGGIERSLGAPLFAHAAFLPIQPPREAPIEPPWEGPVLWVLLEEATGRLLQDPNAPWNLPRPLLFSSLEAAQAHNPSLLPGRLHLYQQGYEDGRQGSLYRTDQRREYTLGYQIGWDVRRRGS